MIDGAVYSGRLEVQRLLKEFNQPIDGTDYT